MQMRISIGDGFSQGPLAHSRPTTNPFLVWHALARYCIERHGHQAHHTHTHWGSICHAGRHPVVSSPGKPINIVHLSSHDHTESIKREEREREREVVAIAKQRKLGAGTLRHATMGHVRIRERNFHCPAVFPLVKALPKASQLFAKQTGAGSVSCTASSWALADCPRMGPRR